MTKSGVYIIGFSDCGESVCAASGRISTQKGSALEIFERSHDEEKNALLISKVIRSGHTSTTEHMLFNLAFENVSVVVEQFMIEFRLASFTVKSRRYVDFSDSGYYIPPLSEELHAKYVDHMETLFSLYSALCECGIPKEDARFVLPYSFFSNFYCSLNGRELVNVLRAMLYGRGRLIPEIHSLGVSLLEECKKKAPGVFSCFDGNERELCDLPDLSFLNLERERSLKGDVLLLSSTPDCERLVARTALAESAMISDEAAEALLSDDAVVARVIDAVLASSRPRALESATFTFRLNDISLSTLTHVARHRMQSLLVPQLSRCDRNCYIIPPSIGATGLLDKYIDAFEQTAILYRELKASGVPDGESVYCLLA